jgi:hypothetical protein
MPGDAQRLDELVAEAFADRPLQSVTGNALSSIEALDVLPQQARSLCRKGYRRPVIIQMVLASATFLLQRSASEAGFVIDSN